MNLVANAILLLVGMALLLAILAAGGALIDWIDPFNEREH